MRPLAEAQRDVLAAVPPLPVIEIPLHEALGLGLARPVLAPHDVPPFTNSAMDGYAVQGADVGSAPVTLRLLEDVPAGYVASARVSSGTAIKIMTGAPMPGGADTVVKVEVTEPEGEGAVRILAATEAGTAVRPAGSDLAAGAPVFEAGERLTPPPRCGAGVLGGGPGGEAAPACGGAVHRRRGAAARRARPRAGSDTRHQPAAAHLDAGAVRSGGGGPGHRGGRRPGAPGGPGRGSGGGGHGDHLGRGLHGRVRPGEDDPRRARNHRLLEGGDAARQTLRIRPHRRDPAARLAGQSGLGHGRLRAVRPPGPPPHDGMHRGVPSSGSGEGRRRMAQRSGQNRVHPGSNRDGGRGGLCAPERRPDVQRAFIAGPGGRLRGCSGGDRPWSRRGTG